MTPTPLDEIAGLLRAALLAVALAAGLSTAPRADEPIAEYNLADSDSHPLDGAHKYTIHFDKGATLPVGAFWSITLYDRDGFQVVNSLNRFAVSSWTPFMYNPDGSLDLYVENESPGPDKNANWLPAPAGPFNLTMRLYAPRQGALTGKWNPPVVKVQGPSVLLPQ